MLSYLFYELSRTPRVLAAVREELDLILGANANPEHVHSLLSSPNGPIFINRICRMFPLSSRILCSFTRQPLLPDILNQDPA